jgi:hypothetical protein
MGGEEIVGFAKEVLRMALRARLRTRRYTLVW